MSKRARVTPGAIEIRAAASTEVRDGKIAGTASVFNKWAQIGNGPAGWREQVAPGTFSKTLAERDIVYLDNHDTGKPIARTSAGTLALRQSARGLEYEATPPDTSYGRDLVENIKNGNIRGNSFGFEIVKDDWTDDDGNPADEWTGTHRTIREVKLYEISATAFPAYEDTDISARSAILGMREWRAKYNADEMKDMAAKGQAMKNANGDPSYPIKDEEDLDNAVHAVGRGGADHDAIRVHIMACAKALGLSSKIPDNWAADGSLKNSAGTGDQRAAKATYADLETCGECGATGQYGPFCSGCGNGMKQGDGPAGDFCTSCGGKLSGKRSAHVCETRASVPGHEDDDQHLQQCLAGIDASLDEAMKHFTGAARAKLPPEVNQGIDLVTAASKLVAHALATHGVPDPDKPNGNKYAAPDARSARADSGDDGKVNCPTCKGKGKILGGHRDCPDCGAKGKVTPEKADQIKEGRSVYDAASICATCGGTGDIECPDCDGSARPPMLSNTMNDQPVGLRAADLAREVELLYRPADL